MTPSGCALSRAVRKSSSTSRATSIRDRPSGNCAHIDPDPSRTRIVPRSCAKAAVAAHISVRAKKNLVIVASPTLVLSVEKAGTMARVLGAPRPQDLRQMALTQGSLFAFWIYPRVILSGPTAQPRLVHEVSAQG